MKVSCPKCEKIYNINASRIPEEGVPTRCKVCDQPFRIRLAQTIDLESLLEEEQAIEDRKSVV